ncbi:MAG: alpha/beta hydrolase [Acidobacteriia bacterium]|nr:alpha/beta hydrolase [Terriglobia bacterium]
MVSTKPSLVLLPGFLCDQTVWKQQIAALADIAEAACMEWGREHDSILAMAEAVLRWAPPSFALAGHSMGGRVAFQILRLAPERVTRVALLNTGSDARPSGEAGEAEERGRRRLLAIARSQGMRAMTVEWLKGMLPAYRQDDTALVEEIIGMFERKSPDLFEIQMLALLGRPNATPLLAVIHCPALVLTGRDDGWSTPARHLDMAQLIPKSELVLIPKCGHMSTMERPDEVTAAMRAWLERPLT